MTRVSTVFVQFFVLVPWPLIMILGLGLLQRLQIIILIYLM